MTRTCREDRGLRGGGLCFADPELATNGVAPAGNGFYNYCGRNNPADGSKTPFAPRIGFAYRPFGGKAPWFAEDTASFGIPPSAAKLTIPATSTRL